MTPGTSPRRVTADPALDRHYAAEASPPPDRLRFPVSLRALSRELGIPFETVRRRVSGLVESGVVEWQQGIGSGGVIVPARVLASTAHVANNRRAAKNLTRLPAALIDLERRHGDPQFSPDGSNQ